MFCMNCGKQMPDGAKFCFECGAAMATQQPTQQPVQQPAGKPVVQAPVIPAPTPGQAAVVASNAAGVTSNTGVVASNVGGVASNTAVAASNTAVAAATGMSAFAKVIIGILIAAVILVCGAFFIPLNDYGDTLSDFIMGNAYWDEDENGIHHCMENFETSFNEGDLSSLLDSFPPAVSAQYKLALGILDFVAGQFDFGGLFNEDMMNAAFGMALQGTYVEIEIVEFDFNAARNECAVLVRMESDGQVDEDWINMVKVGKKWYISDEYFGDSGLW